MSEPTRPLLIESTRSRAPVRLVFTLVRVSGTGVRFRLDTLLSPRARDAKVTDFCFPTLRNRAPVPRVIPGRSPEGTWRFHDAKTASAGSWAFDGGRFLPTRLPKNRASDASDQNPLEQVMG